MSLILPPKVLAQHIGVLGKTGSGKTSTSKLIVEQAVAAGARVCVLDPIKSDWWGVTSSADGKRPGLPFHILGGPHGHVPLHAAAGKAVAEIVASGALPLSIIDMADFAAGGLQRFFIDFAEALFKRMQGVLHLVIEEAHEFAPKERAGFGDENLAIHWAKKLATGSRTKGIRLIVSTQRTQSLHNAVLGSCDTLIAHRFTAPADQEPVLKWLKANLKPELAKEVAASLSSLKTGEGWVCSGEAGLFERRKFPRINSYDNTATPDHNTADREVTTAPVDQDKLRALIGEAVKAASANDPKALKARIAELEKALQSATTLRPAVDTTEIERKARIRGKIDGYSEACQDVGATAKAAIEAVKPLKDATATLLENLGTIVKNAEAHEKAGPKQTMIPLEPSRPRPELARTGTIRREITVTEGTGGEGIKMPKAERAILTVLAQHPDGRTKAAIAVQAGYSSSGGGFNNAVSALRTAGRIETVGDRLCINQAGCDALGRFEQLPQGSELIEHWMNHRELGKAERAILRVFLETEGRPMSKEDLAAAAGYEPTGGGFNNALSRLRTLELIEGRAEIRLTSHLIGS